MPRLALLLMFVAVLALPVAETVLAQESVSVDPVGTEDVNYFDFFVVKGGWIAYVLIVISVVALALTIEHCVSIRRAAIVPPEAVERARTLLTEKRYVEAVKFTAEEPSMLGYVLHAGLTEAPNGFEAMERALEESLEERAARLFRKTEYIHIIGNVSPMIGLFGTVTGMILLFAEIHAADAFPGARIVADRIAVALITTFWGLAVAIPALSVFAIFRNRIDVLTAECALAAESLLSVFKPGGAGQPASASAPPRTASTAASTSADATASSPLVRAASAVTATPNPQTP